LTSRMIASTLALLAFACSKPVVEPPPPASSGTLPPAPPGATGPLAGGRESARPAFEPFVPEPVDPSVPIEPDPAPFDPQPSDDEDGGGMPL
jgi:hypothetical protein